MDEGQSLHLSAVQSLEADFGVNPSIVLLNHSGCYQHEDKGSGGENQQPFVHLIPYQLISTGKLQETIIIIVVIIIMIIL